MGAVVVKNTWLSPTPRFLKSPAIEITRNGRMIFLPKQILIYVELATFLREDLARRFCVWTGTILRNGP